MPIRPMPGIPEPVEEGFGRNWIQYAQSLCMWLAVVLMDLWFVLDGKPDWMDFASKPLQNLIYQEDPRRGAMVFFGQLSWFFYHLFVGYGNLIAGVRAMEGDIDLVNLLAIIFGVRYDDDPDLEMVIKRIIYKHFRPLFWILEDPIDGFERLLAKGLDLAHNRDYSWWDYVLLYVALNLPEVYLWYDDPGKEILTLLATWILGDYQVGDNLWDILGAWLEEWTGIEDVFWDDPIRYIKDYVIGFRDEWIENSVDWIQDIGEHVLSKILIGEW